MFRKFMNDNKHKFGYLVYIISVFALVILANELIPHLTAKNENIYLLLIAIEITVFVLPTLIYVRLERFEYTSGLQLGLPEINKLPVCIGIILTMVAMNILLGFIIPHDPEAGGFLTSAGGLADSELSVAGIIISLAVVPAMCEELVFRSVLTREENKYGALFSMLSTSLLFAIVHFDTKGFIAYFVSGFILSLTVYITRSVICAMLVHILYNIYSLTFESYFWASVSGTVNLTLIIIVVLFILFIGLIIIFSEGQRLFQEYSSGGTPPPEGYKSRPRDEDGMIIEDTENKTNNTVYKKSFLRGLPEVIASLLIFTVYLLIKG